jgi:hypothetical protein
VHPYSVPTTGTLPKFTKIMKGKGHDMETYERNPTQHPLPIPTTEVNTELRKGDEECYVLNVILSYTVAINTFSSMY